MIHNQLNPENNSYLQNSATKEILMHARLAGAKALLSAEQPTPDSLERGIDSAAPEEELRWYGTEELNR